MQKTTTIWKLCPAAGHCKKNPQQYGNCVQRLVITKKYGNCVQRLVIAKTQNNMEIVSSGWSLHAKRSFDTETLTLVVNFL